MCVCGDNVHEFANSFAYTYYLSVELNSCQCAAVASINFLYQINDKHFSQKVNMGFFRRNVGT